MLSMRLCILAILCISSSALAQDGFGDSALDPTPAPTNTSSSSSYSSSSANGFGVGATSTLTGLNGLSVVLDAGKTHYEGIFLIGEEVLNLGARGWFHIHESKRADLSLGAGFGFQRIDVGGESETPLHIEGGLQIRVFIADNVALSADAGLAFVVQDGDDQFVLGSHDLFGGAGIAYFFK